MKLAMVLLLAAAPAHSGGYWEGSYYHRVSDEKMLTEGYTRDLASGLSLSAAINISMKYHLAGDSQSHIVDYQANQTVEGNTYYSRVKSNVTQTLCKQDEDPITRRVNAETYIIMPKKFDANQAINMHFSDENDSAAEVKAKFTYDGKEYEFSIGSGINESETLNLFLYPYCPYFEGLDLDYVNAYTDPVSQDDFDYEGSFVIQALKT